MQIDIYDVGHGHCSVITTPNGQRIMIDCGTRTGERLWWPSIHHLGEEVAMLALLNLDEDHICDFGSVLERCRVRSVLTNPTIGAQELRLLKKQGMGPGAEAVMKWLNTPRVSVQPASAADLGGVAWTAFWNSHGGACETSNDLSLAFFAQFGSFKIMFAGDLEAKGWCGMMANDDFRRWAAGVNMFVASHHGRESGCCDELFKIMKPEIIVISDDYMQHDTQETNGWYRARCHGAGLIADPMQRRHVMTTRNDGTMRINAKADGSWTLRPKVAVTDWPLQRKASTLLTQAAGRNALTDPLGLGGLNFLTPR
jgi:beta-lactamase superfamily II metal-dependent hydrolase